jgi:hypothetical protein
MVARLSVVAGEMTASGLAGLLAGNRKNTRSGRDNFNRKLQSGKADPAPSRPSEQRPLAGDLGWANYDN